MSCTRPPGLPPVDATTPPVLTLTGPVTRSRVAELCDDLRLLMEGTAGTDGIAGTEGTAGTAGAVVVCDAEGLGTPGLMAVDLLARLRLTAGRGGGRIRLRAPDPALLALLDLVGLRFEVERKPEQREPPLGVEEEVESGEAAV
ncbi:STAS domain-containing protein [Streptomyces sp. NPDC088766]|uniref:STAS domain-containing protein n=1 Tax=Streptomyces sp. NPDC088766 TaxID=3365893 RepID=UPI00380310C2